MFTNNKTLSACDIFTINRDPIVSFCLINFYLNITLLMEVPTSNSSQKSVEKQTDASTSKEEHHTSKPSTSKTLSRNYSLLVNPKQRGNPILRSITNVPWEYEDIVPDYQMGATSCALFLSLRYHNLNPDYIHERLKLLGKNFELRVLLVQVCFMYFNFA